MTIEDIREKNEEAVIFSNPDFNGCIIGISTDDRVIYSLHKMCKWYKKKNKCSFEEALEFIECNTLRSLPYQENSPIVMDDL